MVGGFIGGFVTTIEAAAFGVIVCLNLGIGQQTPPVASVLLTVCSATGLKIEDVIG
ncbi:MAG: hypothetical protein AAGC57_18685 [Pseudomonadota bacterium]